MAKTPAATERTYDALPDSLDFRDKMYVPTLVEVPKTIDLQTYLDHNIPILDQGREGACTGFGWATVVNYLLRTRRDRDVEDEQPVSPRIRFGLNPTDKLTRKQPPSFCQQNPRPTLLRRYRRLLRGSSGDRTGAYHVRT